MIDMHTHLLPGIDDGVSEIDETRKLLDAYAEAGFRWLAATPHVDHPTVHTRVDQIREAYRQVKEEARQRGITLLLGSELYVTGARPQPGIPLCGRFQMVEFHTAIKPLFANDMVFHFGMLGLTVILAHVDRYRWFTLNDPSIQRMREMGVLFQMNIDAVQTQRGQTLLESGMIDFLASDNHGGERTSVSLKTFSSYPAMMEKGLRLLSLQQN